MIFADKLIALRKKAGWSQEELAQQLNVSRQSVSKWEGAQSVPDLDKIVQLSRIFGVSTDYLLKDELEAQETAEPEPEQPVPEPSSISRPQAAHIAALPAAETFNEAALRVRTAAFSDIFLFLSFSPFLPNICTFHDVITGVMQACYRLLLLYITIMWKKSLSYQGGNFCYLIILSLSYGKIQKGFDKTSVLW